MAIYRHKRLVQLLLIEGANINLRDKCSKIILYLTARDGYWEVIQLFLESGVNINIRGKDS